MRHPASWIHGEVAGGLGDPGGAGVGGDAEDADAAGGVLDDVTSAMLRPCCLRTFCRRVPGCANMLANAGELPVINTTDLVPTLAGLHRRSIVQRT